MFLRFHSSIRYKYSLSVRLLVLLLLVHSIATACSADTATEAEDEPVRQRRFAAEPDDTASVRRSRETATISLLSNPFVANQKQSNNLASYFDRIDADFTLDAYAIENRHKPDISDTIYTIRFGNSMLEFYAPTHSGELHLQTADIRSGAITLRNNLRVGMSQAELMNRLKSQGEDLKITQTANEVVASNREGAPITLHFFLAKGKVQEIKYNGYVD
ncbi:hypothetical protein [Pontibacter akesuensis]|uniref:Beta-lactamase-inhibitor-like, PepSY-like n=1 Tax=Pontibacter akesuensis TaxID=388950 RepID=A0A1I7J7L1_9BACT|nr:hypothetical protein [Pontibacter akesuensis]GHA71910.1 hypothetical protein GCM10007389_26960 [Pontibacter akesuensis]SFU81196.1 hypothetical protein SAMN04487941_2568 [Pontibacter akesuensis]